MTDPTDLLLYLDGQAVALDPIAWERHMRRLEEVALPPRRESVEAELRRLFCRPPPALSDELRRELARHLRVNPSTYVALDTFAADTYERMRYTVARDNGDYHA